MSKHRYTVQGDAQNASSSEFKPLAGAATTSPRPSTAREDLPVALSTSQAYYWKRSWQEAEAEVLAEIEAGKARTFSGAEAAIRYLLGPDDH